MNKLKASKMADIFFSFLPEVEVTDSAKSKVMVRFSHSNHDFACYFKNICHGGNSYADFVMRAQLPKCPDFDTLKANEIFLFVGYDEMHQVFVVWDPVVVKSRLNKKNYVSFFCRQDLASVSQGSITEAKLKNGLRYYLFHQTDVTMFLEFIIGQMGDAQASEPKGYTIEEDEENISMAAEEEEEYMKSKTQDENKARIMRLIELKLKAKALAHKLNLEWGTKEEQTPESIATEIVREEMKKLPKEATQIEIVQKVVPVIHQRGITLSFSDLSAIVKKEMEGRDVS